MIIIRLQGGLGNQMFQYALYRSLKAHGKEVKIDDVSGYEHDEKRVVMLEGSVETLRQLKQRGYLLGMVTNGNSLLQNTKLDTAGIRDLFDMAVVSDDIGIWKPDKGIFEYAMHTLGVTPQQSLFVGDHPINDIQGALGAGMQAVRVDYGSFEGKPCADVYTVKNVSELLEVLTGKK